MGWEYGVMVEESVHSLISWEAGKWYGRMAIFVFYDDDDPLFA
jgi:hypothetical protein